MLVAAAAAEGHVPLERVKTVNGTVVNLDTSATLAYGALIEAASKLPAPTNPQLKHPRDFKLIGKPLARHQLREKVNARQQFSIEMTLPGMLVATVVPSIAPALCNAITAAMRGQRIRTLPLVKAGFTFA